MTAGDTLLIPNTVHFIWMTQQAERADDPLPEEVGEQILRWHQYASNCSVRCWSWGDFADLMAGDKDGKRIIELVNSCKMHAMKADIMRLIIISRLGGIWSDVKNQPLIDMKPLIPLDCSLFIAEHWPIEQKPDTTDFFSNSFFGAEKDNPFINACIDFALDKVESKFDDASITSITGGGVFTRLAKRDSSLDLVRITSDQCWNNWLKRTPMKYNAGDLHWSKRQKTESIYN